MTRTVLGGGSVLDPVAGEVRRADAVAPEGDPWSFDGLGSRVRRAWKDGVAVR